jgi:hypothetical protein
MKQAKDRPAELEQNKLETGTLIEVQLRVRVRVS